MERAASRRREAAIRDALTGAAGGVVAVEDDARLATIRCKRRALKASAAHTAIVNSIGLMELMQLHKLLNQSRTLVCPQMIRRIQL